MKRTMKRIEKIREYGGWAMYLGIIDGIDDEYSADVLAIIPSDRDVTPEDFDDYNISCAAAHWFKLTGENIDPADISW